MYQLIHRNFASQICIFSNTKSYISKSILKIKMQHSKHLFKNKPRGSLILCPFLFPSNGKCFKKNCPQQLPQNHPQPPPHSKKTQGPTKTCFFWWFFLWKTITPFWHHFLPKIPNATFTGHHRSWRLLNHHPVTAREARCLEPKTADPVDGVRASRRNVPDRKCWDQRLVHSVKLTVRPRNDGFP